MFNTVNCKGSYENMNWSYHRILIAKHLQNKKKEESFDLREIQQIIRELTVGINVFEELPAISLRPHYDKGNTFTKTCFEVLCVICTALNQ